MRIRTSHPMRGVILLTVFATILATLALPAPTVAQQRSQPRSQPHDLDIPAGDLAQALHRLGEQVAMQIVYDQTLVEGRRAPAVSGSMEVDAALARLLAPSRLAWEYANGKTIVLRAAPAEAAPSEPPATGTLSGRVTQAGEAVAGATVTAMSAALEKARVVTTDDEGNYELTDLPPGEYSLRFEFEGLVSVVKEAEVSPEESTAVDIQMSLHEIREDMVVVGSRLRSTPVESALPITVITREEIDRSGASGIAEVLSQRPEVSVNNNGDTNLSGLPASFVINPGASGDQAATNSTTVQLRGLPEGTTLVLVNGRRVGGSAAFINGVFDLSTLPLALVERIEILPFGASAIYGGDGLAGVVNIVLKKDASGFDVRTRYSFADGYDTTDTGVTWGKAWSRGSLTVTGSFSDLGTLTSSERSLTADQDFTRFGGLDFRPVFGNIYSLDGCPPLPELCLSVPLDQRGNLPGLDAPVAAIPTGQDGQNLTPEDFVGTAGLQNRSSFENRFFSPAEQFSLWVNGRYQVSRRLELFSDLLYTRRKVPAWELSLFASGGSIGFFAVPATNPFNPFGVDVGVDFTFKDTGVFLDLDNEYVKPLLGAGGEWGRGERRWNWEVTGWLSEDRSSTSPNLIGGGDAAAINAALASTDPATALNPFRTDGGPLASPSTLRALFVPPAGLDLRGDFGSLLWGANGSVRGPLFQLPAGPVEGLLGAEYQREELEFQTGSQDVDGDSDTRALFGELRVPLLARRAPSAERRELLALTGAVRTDDNRRFEGSGTTQILGLEFRPLPSVLLRASYSDAFKPLGLFIASFTTDLSTEFPTPITDPQMGGQTFLVGTISGGGVSPGLKPETSTSRSLGVAFTPESARGSRLSLTAWDIRFRNRLVFPNSVAGQVSTHQFLVDNEAQFPERVIRDPQTGIITLVDVRQINLNFTEIAGVDLGLDWRFRTRAGDFSPSLGATYTYKYDEQLAPTSPLQDNLAMLRTTGWAPRWKLTPRLGWDYQDQFYITLTGRYISAYEDPWLLFTGPEAGTVLTLGDLWLVDLNLDFALGRWLAAGSKALSETRLRLGAVNLFNRLPDFCNSCLSAGYDASQYDIRGRFVSAELKFNF